MKQQAITTQAICLYLCG